MENNKIFFWKNHNGDGVYFNVDFIEAAKDNYTLKPDLSCTLNEWYDKYESTARLVNGKIVLGKSEEQKQKETAEVRKQQILLEIDDLERKGVRASRAIALNIHTKDDVQRLTDIENKIAKLRKEFESL